MEIPFIGGAYNGRSTNINAQICQNFYPEMDQFGGKSVLSLMGTPGLLSWYSSGSEAECRGWALWDDALFMVIGATLYKLTTSATATNVGTLGTSTGKVWMEGGTTHLCLVDGIDGYYQISGATTLTTITDVDFPSLPTSLAYQDGFFIVTEEDTDSFYISDSEDASSWASLNFASAEDTPDDALAVVSHERHLYIFGKETTEIFYNSGDADFPFSRVAGGVLEFGAGSANSIVAGDEGLFCLDHKYRVRIFQGFQSQVVTPPQVEYHFNKYDTKSDAIAYTYHQEGHAFYVITFPTDNRTWAYDISTGYWHTRSSGVKGERHKSNLAVWFADKVLVGDYKDGNIYEMDLDTYTDNGDEIQGIRAAQVIHQDRKNIFHSRFELDFEAGVGLITGQGSDPQAMLDWSDDGGKTWSNEHWADIGAIGDYKTRTYWERLGHSKERIYRVTISDPIKRRIVNAHLDAEAGIS